MRMPDKAQFTFDILKIFRSTHSICDIIPMLGVQRRGMSKDEIIPMNDERKRSKILAVFFFDVFRCPKNRFPHVPVDESPVRRSHRPFIMVAKDDYGAMFPDQLTALIRIRTISYYITKAHDLLYLFTLQFF